jgi:RNA polymerase sigma factor (sigma-70 family)
MRRAELESELERVHPAAFAWALRCAGSREAAEDALHEAYLRVLDGRARFEGRSSFRTWLFGVIRRTAAEARRRSLFRLGRLRRWFGEGEGAGRPDPAAELEGREERAKLRGALAGLSKRQQQMIHLVFYQELSVQEAADVLDIPVGTARTHYERAKARLRSALSRGR